MNKVFSLVAVSLCLSGCASSGQGASAALDGTETSGGAVIQDSRAQVVEVSADAAEAEDPNEVICRRVQQTGSRMMTRVCSTRAEIEARAEKDKESMRQSRALQSGGDCALNANC